MSVSPTLVVPLLTRNNRQFRVRTLLDPGSGTNWIVGSLLKQVYNTTKGHETLEVATFNGIVKKSFPLVEVYYMDGNNNKQGLMCYVYEAYTRHITVQGMLDHITTNAPNKHDIFKNMVDPTTTNVDHGEESQGIGMILCSTSINRLRTSDKIILIKTLDILLEPTIFGVAISGAVPSALRGQMHVILANNIAPRLVCKAQDPRVFLAEDNDSIPENINFLWAQDTLGILPEEMHEDDKIAWEHFLDSMTRDPQTGQFTVRLPWNSKKHMLRDNISVAAGRTRSLQKTMIQNQAYLEAMFKAKADLEDRDYVEIIDPNIPTCNPIYYLPYRGIVKADSKTTSCRIVMDGSSKQTASDISLNQALYQGPNLVLDLAMILLRFMLGYYGVVADIEKAFLRILIAECDRDALRFFWPQDPFDPFSPLITYRFKAVMFGSAASPFQLAAVIHVLIKDDCHNAHVQQALGSCIYVDNVVYATDSEESVVEFFEVARTMFEGGSFNLRQWSSNSNKLMRRAREQGVAEEGTIIKVLGYFWDIDRDMFLYNTEFEWDGKFTKRSALRLTNRVFDPNGILTPITMSKRVFMQRVWDHPLLKREWDVSFEFIEDMKEVWLLLVKETHTAVTKAFKRRAVLTQDTEIHIFSDASKDSYGAVVYARTPPCHQAPNGRVDLLCAKGKVAPKDGKQTIPRNELAGFVVAAQKVPYLHKAWPLTEQNKVYIWTDAKVVLNWLSQYNIRETFIHNRVKTIRELCIKEKTIIKHVPGTMNPADLITKVQKASDFINNDGWFGGPSWLRNQKDWPDNKEEHTLYPQDSENTTAVFYTTAINVEKTSLLKYFADANFESGLRKTAYILRAFQHNSRITNFIQPIHHSDLVTKKELNHAKNVAIKVMQQDMFGNELSLLKQKKSVMEGPAKKLNLYLDPDGLIRCKGRLENLPDADISNEPILVHGRHPFTESFIRYKHMHFNCSSRQYTLHKVRKDVHGPGLTVAVNRVIRECNACRILRAKPYAYPKQPPLPKERLMAQRPFAISGVDFSGPHFVREGRGKRKVWIALFTCFVSRAIHLEAVPDLTAITFLQALRSLAWRKGAPRILLSDNATNFTKSRKLLAEIKEQKIVQDALNVRGVEWNFTPPHAPWFGAIYERLIQVLKREMTKLIGQSLLTYFELTTQLTEVEGVINSRPLAKLGFEDVLTPNNILTGDDHNDDVLNVLDTSQIMTEALEVRNNLPKLFQQTARRKAKFWNTFQQQYLESIKFSEDKMKHTGSGLTPKVGDLVIIHSHDPRLRWRKAIILETIISEDGECRKCRIKTSTGETTRATSHLHPLELSVENFIDQSKDNESTDEEFLGFENNDVRTDRALQLRDRISQLSSE